MSKRTERLEQELSFALERIVNKDVEIARLQRIIDSRPAINAGLPDTYIKWSQEIYVTDFAKATQSLN
jgi:hypothetical protein